MKRILEFKGKNDVPVFINMTSVKSIGYNKNKIVFYWNFVFQTIIPKNDYNVNVLKSYVRGE